jgi:hypothetical protein
LRTLSRGRKTDLRSQQQLQQQHHAASFSFTSGFSASSAPAPQLRKNTAVVLIFSSSKVLHCLGSFS